jgi:hypothetical protein
LPNVEDAEAGADMKKALCAIGQYPVERNALRQIARHVIAIDADDTARLQLITHVADEAVVEENVDIGCEDETSPCTPNSNVLSNHLEQRKRRGIRELVVDCGWNGHDPNACGPKVFRPLQSLFQRRPIGRRIPFDQDQLGIEPMAAALGDEAVHEMLHSTQHVAAVIVVSRCYDDAELRQTVECRLRIHYPLSV